MPVVLMHQQTLQNLIPTPKVWLSEGLAGPSGMATVWDQATGNGAVRPSGRGSIRGWPLHWPLCSSPCPRSLPHWCCSYAWAWPCWLEFWLDCGPILSYCCAWRSVLLPEPGCHPWASSACLALPCLPHWLPSSHLTFPRWANPLWLLPNIPPLTGSHSHLLLKTRDASLQDGFRNYLIMHKNSFYISKVHF